MNIEEAIEGQDEDGSVIIRVSARQQEEALFAIYKVYEMSLDLRKIFETT